MKEIGRRLIDLPEVTRALVLFVPACLTILWAYPLLHSVSEPVLLQLIWMTGILTILSVGAIFWIQLTENAIRLREMMEWRNEHMNQIRLFRQFHEKTRKSFLVEGKVGTFTTLQDYLYLSGEWLSILDVQVKRGPHRAARARAKSRLATVINLADPGTVTPTSLRVSSVTEDPTTGYFSPDPREQGRP